MLFHLDSQAPPDFVPFLALHIFEYRSQLSRKLSTVARELSQEVSVRTLWHRIGLQLLCRASQVIQHGADSRLAVWHAICRMVDVVGSLIRRHEKSTKVSIVAAKLAALIGSIVLGTPRGLGCSNPDVWWNHDRGRYQPASGNPCGVEAAYGSSSGAHWPTELRHAVKFTSRWSSRALMVASSWTVVKAPKFHVSHCMKAR